MPGHQSEALAQTLPSASRSRPTLAALFDPKNNALNALRLLLAISVIAWHSFPLTGANLEYAPLRQLLGHIGVDGFFTISGYLIVASWLRNPQVRSFMRARVLRIFPGYWVSLCVTALAIAPLSPFAAGSSVGSRFWSAALSYVGQNAALWVSEYDIAGTPTGVPYPGVWNGSIWTLFWEFLCYLAVLVLGVLGLLRRSAVSVVAFVLLTLAVLVTSYGPVENLWVTNGSHFGLPFVAGTLIYQFRDKVIVRGRYLLLSALLIAVSAALPDYRIVAALPLAYLTLSLGALGKHRRLQFREDLSYGTYIYAFPLQQVLALFGVAALGVAPFALIALVVTLPIAAASWFWVEKPTLRLKHLRAVRTVQQAAVADRQSESKA